MDASQPGLFELPEGEPQSPPERSRRGRNRETWSCRATAEVTIVDEAALREAAALAEEQTVTIGLEADPAVEAQGQGPEARDTDDAFDVLVWLIWPTDGLGGVLEAGAFRILSVGSEVAAGSSDRGALTWTVTVKLTDVDAVRRLATQAHPEQAASIKESLAVAWQCAADPFAPLRSIPGIAWQPGQVDLQPLPRRG